MTDLSVKVDTVIKTDSKDEDATATRLELAEELFEVAASQPLEAKLRKAIIKRIANPLKEDAEFKELLRLKTDCEADKLCDTLIDRHNMIYNTEIPKDTDPQIMMAAFAKVAKKWPLAIN